MPHPTYQSFDGHVACHVFLNGKACRGRILRLKDVLVVLVDKKAPRL